MHLTVSNTVSFGIYLLHWGSRMYAPTSLSNIKGREEEVQLRAGGSHGLPTFSSFLQRTWVCCWTPVCLAQCQELLRVHWNSEIPVVTHIVTYKVWPSSPRLWRQQDQPASVPDCWAPRFFFFYGKKKKMFVTRFPLTNIVCKCANLCTIGEVDLADSSCLFFLLGRLTPSSSRRLES